MTTSSSPSKSALPTPETVAQIITGLIGRSVSVKKAPALVRGKTPTATAVYVCDDGKLRGAAVADIALASSAGAALTLLPAPDAAQAVKTGQWNDALAENFREILNVASNVFNVPGQPHTRLKEVFLTPAALPAEVEAGIKAASGRLDIEVSIPGYGPGKMTVYSF